MNGPFEVIGKRVAEVFELLDQWDREIEGDEERERRQASRFRAGEGAVPVCSDEERKKDERR